MASVLQSQSLSSSVEVAFWHTLSQKKLNDFKLSAAAVKIYGGACPPSKGAPARVLLGEFSFRERKLVPAGHTPMEGALYTLNTVEDFKKFNKAKLLHTHGQQVWEDIQSGRSIQEPSKLSPFVLLCFPNLKTHRYYYWFAFPAVVTSAVFTAAPPTSLLPFSSSRLTAKQVAQALAAIKTLQQTDPGRGSHFVLRIEASQVRALTLAEYAAQRQQTGGAKTSTARVVFGFRDPGTLPAHPGWPMRNYLLLLNKAWGITSAEVLCLRDRPEACLDAGDGLRSDVELQSLLFATHCQDQTTDQTTDKTTPKPAKKPTEKESKQGSKPWRAVGWEKNQKGRLGARMVDLKSVFDPKTLARTSADLNLKLMRWRSLPSLDLAALKSAKCLMLGAGTLGCNVARTLLGWGVRHVSFVDNGKVSYSNPVRQPLFTYQVPRTFLLFLSVLIAYSEHFRRLFLRMAGSSANRRYL
jgi:ubiquitin-like modifier-activating enzyme ATG7